MDKLNKGFNINMKKYNIKLDKTELDSLKLFIERTNISGREVQSFMSVVQAINEAERDFFKKPTIKADSFKMSSNAT